MKAAALALCLAAPAAWCGEAWPPPSLEAVQDMRQKSASKSQRKGEARVRAVAAAGLQAGVLAGYAAEMRRLRGQVQALSETLDMIFDYRTLMRTAVQGPAGQFVLPPAVREARGIVDAGANGGKPGHISDRRGLRDRPPREGGHGAARLASGAAAAGTRAGRHQAPTGRPA